MAKSIYDLIGGDEALRQLVETFYEVMTKDLSYKAIRDLHPDNITSSVEKLYSFLSGWFGGPNLYMERFGHPRLRARHLPFPIDVNGRDQWVSCMNDAFAQTGIKEKFTDENYDKMMKLFFNTANFLRNQ